MLDSTFVNKSLNPVFDEESEYGYGWWIDNYKNQKILLMRGHLGQYVILLPEKNLIFVRLGQQKEGKKVKGVAKELPSELETVSLEPRKTKNEFLFFINII